MLQQLSQEQIDAHKASGSEPAVYCGTYGKYNDGSLKGMWIDISSFDDSEEFFDFCKQLHADEDDPEYMFQDYENFPERLYCESMNHEDAEKIIEWSHMDEDDRDMLEAYIDCTGDTDVDLQKAQDRCLGKWESLEDYAYYYIDECYPDMPEFCKTYFDYKQFAYDLSFEMREENGYIFEL